MIVMDEGAPNTLGDLMQDRWRLWVYCQNPKCWRGMPIKWADLIARFGESAVFHQATLSRIVCRECRGRDIQWHVRKPYAPTPGLTHTVTPEPYTPKPNKVYEDPLERYRRLTALDEMTTSPGDVPDIDNPKRDPVTFERVMPRLSVVGREVNDNGRAD